MRIKALTTTYSLFFVLRVTIAQEFSNTSESEDGYFWLIPVMLIIIAFVALALYCFFSRKRSYQFAPTAQ